MPLPPVFTEGADTWQQILDLTNPIHRVNEIHAAREILLLGHEAIEHYAAFQSQNAVPFKELRQLVQHLGAVEHRLEAGRHLESLLVDFRAASSAASFAQKEVWNALQSRKGQALLELTPLLDGWRGDARAILKEALEQLPAELFQHGLDGSVESSLALPLSQLRDGLEAATMPSQAAALPERARQLVRQLGQRIAELVANKKRNGDQVSRCAAARCARTANPHRAQPT